PPGEHGLAHRGRRAARRRLPAAVGVPEALHLRGARRRRAGGHDHHARPARHRAGDAPPAVLRPRARLGVAVLRRRTALRTVPGALGVSAADVIVAVLVAVAVLVGVVSCVGVLVSATAYDSLHFTAPASVVSPVLLAIAVVIEEGIGSQAGVKSIIVALL